MDPSINLSAELVDLLNHGKRLREKSYRGRFAPSPTGPLHLGNLRTALVSWLRARLKKGEWLLRIDDLDIPRNRQFSEAILLSWLRARLKKGEWLLRIDDLDIPRNRPGAIESIQSDLMWLGLAWDGPMVVQSERKALYENALSALKLQGKLYPCRCTRSVLAKFNRSEKRGFIYPGTCRYLRLPWEIQQGRLPSLRLMVEKEFSMKCGDVVLRRADGYIAYHLATAVDELFLGINEVVRGNDLATSRHSQLAIIDALDQKPLSYLHVPLFLNEDGSKLSKREKDKGLKNLQTNGMNPDEVIGFLASTLELVPNGSALSASELLSELRESDDLLDNLLLS